MLKICKNENFAKFIKLLESSPWNTLNFFLSCILRQNAFGKYENRAPKHHKSRLRPAINGHFKSLFYGRFLDPFLRKFQIAIPLGGFDSQTPFICINYTQRYHLFFLSHIEVYLYCPNALLCLLLFSSRINYNSFYFCLQQRV